MLSPTLRGGTCLNHEQSASADNPGQPHRPVMAAMTVVCFAEHGAWPRRQPTSTRIRLIAGLRSCEPLRSASRSVIKHTKGLRRSKITEILLMMGDAYLVDSE